MMYKMLFKKRFVVTLFIILLVNCPISVFADWTNLGLYGGQIYEIAIDPISEDKMFAGAYYGDGLFVTTNGGTTWEPVLTGYEDGELDGEATFRNTAVWAVKIARPPNNNIIWVAHNYWLGKSTDGGVTWTHIPNSTIQGESDNFRYIESLAIDPNNPLIVYVGTGGADGSDSKGAIYKTINGGSAWEKLGIIDEAFDPDPDNDPIDYDERELNNEFYSTVRDIAIHPLDGDIIWALDFNGILGKYLGLLYLSIDGGQTWGDNIKAWDIGFPAGIAEQPLAIKPDEPNVVFIGSFGGDNFGGIVRVVYPKNPDGSVDWEGEIAWTSPLETGSHNVRALAFDPQDPDVLYAALGLDANFKLLKSTDGGLTFLEFSHEQQFISLSPHPTNSNVIFGGDRLLGVYKGTFDSGDYVWTSINSGISAIKVNDIAVDPNNSRSFFSSIRFNRYGWIYILRRSRKLPGKNKR